jgi:tetratricopeptide (TPR) repeat protein
MLGMGKAKPFDRQETLRVAEQLRSKGKWKKAAIEFKKILAHVPADAEVHGKLAPILVTLGERAAASKSYLVAAEGHINKGFADKAIAIYLQAADLDPTDHKLYEKVARLHQERGRKAEAIKVLCDGAKKQKGRDGRTKAIRLYQCAIALDSHHLEATLGLARSLSSDGRGKEARKLLEQFATFAKGTALKKVRGLQFRLLPTPGAFFRWLKA